ncbi:amino acid ABC transporter permease [Pseudoscardovia suis]|uniref:ABC transporter permease n=1 Tax=Pseudoscardovia suis TaxID=987063 RepID=A0A261ERP3_9BIFI|nr:amino acid ABC transporter permease [Pseudoscardovia suis]OZG49528.1 ABC transporter permease [Pseudoscardovia suis]PJJ69648.1 L-cystine transport system permease protein [Pseudoscardovia suis]
MNLDVDFMISDMPTVVAALPSTLILSLDSMLWALVFALICGGAQLARVPVLDKVTLVINTFIKGIPLVVQLLFCYYAVPYVVKWFDGLMHRTYDPQHLPYFGAAVLALALNFGAYITDVVISSTRAIDRGQWESAYACGMTRFQALRRVVAPQIVVISLPNMTNYFIWLLKGTSLASIVNVVEMLTTARLSAADGYQFLEAYIDAAIIYWIVCAFIEWLSGRIYHSAGSYLLPPNASTA